MDERPTVVYLWQYVVLMTESAKSQLMLAFFLGENTKFWANDFL